MLEINIKSLSIACAAVFSVTISLASAAEISLVNGDFEAGNTGFTTDYTLDQVFLDAGDYWVDTADLFGWSGDVGDHTSGSGNMMMFNGSTQAGDELWAQTVDLVAGVTYEFTGWVNTMNPAPPVLELLVGGVSAGEFTAPDVADTWFLFSFFFTAQNDGAVSLALTNLNLNPSGVDFALDDFGLSSIDDENMLVNPVPAALPLFLTALGLGGATIRSRKKSVAAKLA